MKTTCYVYIAVQLKDLGSNFLYAVDPQGRKDFNNTVQRITFSLSTSSEMMVVRIDIFDDAINEADEGFLIVVGVDPAASNQQEVSNVTLDRNGVALVTILNDDRT